MDVPCHRELEAIGDQRYNIDNVEGSLALWGKLWCLIREIKMHGFQPDLVTSLVF